MHMQLQFIVYTVSYKQNTQKVETKHINDHHPNMFIWKNMYIILSTIIIYPLVI